MAEEKKSRGRGQRGGRGGRDKEREKEFDQRVIDLARVTRVMAGGKRMTFRACVAIGDRRGRVAMGLAKSADVSSAISKAVRQAQKSWINVPLVEDTLPYPVRYKFGAAKVLIKPAPKGSGIIAGGVMNTVLDLAGVKNVVGKMLGSKNKINNTKATLAALESLQTPAEYKKRLVKE